ncbi:exosome complex component Rrp42 [Striga asiatica]|uniref:Exosome complex component Rrp42 n=1 Tax=Striga asiatica TaxID=4170 RepID=A0A5A7PTG2_STRAF|nr:exosome complex component Rrp42 [Striga asiatica]
MDALNSPIEALAVDYLSHGWLAVANSIWAWLAVITAAVGFWRIRGSSSPPPRRGDGIALLKQPEKSAAAAVAVVADSPAEDLVPASCCAVESECSPKGKFSAYYEDDLGEIDGGGCDEVLAAAAESRRECGGWERTMVGVRMGDMGWYRWQDLNVLDGNVVRLWDSRRRMSAAGAVVGGGVR